MEDLIKIYARKVQEMREAQKEYYKARKMQLQATAADWLEKSKKIEKEVDRMTLEILAGSRPGTLF
jgi:hypothetical protein